MRSALRFSLLGLVLACAAEGSGPSGDAGALDASAEGPLDQGAQDLGAFDQGPPDPGLQDLGAEDLGLLDLGAWDLGGQDLGSEDLGSSDQGSGPVRVLVFTRTEGFRHGSISDGLQALMELGTSGGFEVDATEQSQDFNDANLMQYAAVVFLSTTGDVLDPQEEAALERYIQAGGGWVGVHAASDTEYEWAWYGGLVGAYFANHPAQQDATIAIEDPNHPSTQGLPSSWARRDEWYNFRTNPRGAVRVLATLDESTYNGGTMGADHPIAWCHRYDGGRAWYTAGGHTSASYSETEFRAHLLGGVRWAAGLSPGDCTP